MSSKSPVFPMPPPHHFSDYGFDHHFRVLEEARIQQRDIDIDSLRLKLHKPATANSISCSTTPYNGYTTSKKRHKWWNTAFSFFKQAVKPFQVNCNNEKNDVHLARARAFRTATDSMSGPLYETRPTTPVNRNMPLSYGMVSPGRSSYGGVSGNSGCNSPYLSLRELNMERQYLQRMSASASPINLVT